MSIAAAHAAEFYREVAESGVVWSIRDAKGFPAPVAADGKRAMPFWSSESRALAVIRGVRAYSGFSPVPIDWKTFRERWIPGLTRDGLLAGINWSGASASGFDIEPADLQRNVEALRTAASAQLKVLISGGFSGAYEQLLPEFEHTTGMKVATGSGSSQGSGPQTIAAQLARGAPVDVVILSREGLDELIRANRTVAGTDVDLARTPLGVAVRAGAPKPDVGTVEAFKQVVLKAKLVAVPSSTSGIFLTAEVFPRLGIADRINVKLTPRGTGAAAMVAAGEADVAVMPVSEIVHARGVDFAGKLAEEIQLNQVFAAAAVAGAKELEAAKRLIAFLASGRASAAITASGMEPLGQRRAD